MNKNLLQGFEKSMVPWLGKTMKCIDQHVSSELSKNGIPLTRQQVIILKLLYKDGAQPQSNLAFLTERDKTSLTRLINNMEKKNLVARIPSNTDKRVNLIHLTKTGESVFEKVVPTLQSIIQNIQAGISESDSETVIRVMKQIQQNINIEPNSCTNN
jgi:DNA-binding MarR family transcriptional regulator